MAYPKSNSTTVEVMQYFHGDLSHGGAVDMELLPCK